MVRAGSCRGSTGDAITLRGLHSCSKCVDTPGGKRGAVSEATAAMSASSKAEMQRSQILMLETNRLRERILEGAHY